MAEYDNTRYYWIKLSVNFMSSDTVDFLMAQENGAEYIVLYQMLCLKTINNNGELSRKIGEVIVPFDEKKIQRDCKWFSIDTVRIALSLYIKLGLIYEQEDGSLCIANYDRLVGCTTVGAEKKAIQRKAVKQIGGQNGGQMSTTKVDNCPPDIDIRDIDIRDIEIDIREKKEIYKERKEEARASSKKEQQLLLQENKERFMKLYPRFAGVKNYDDSGIDYEVLISEFSKSKFLREKVRTMKLVCEMYQNEIVTGFHRDKAAEEPKAKESAEDKRIDRERHYAMLRNEAESVADRNVKNAMSIPTYKKINSDLLDARRESAKAEAYNQLEALPQINWQIKQLEEKRKAILKTIGLTVHDLVPQYKCKKCSDTGFLPDGRACDCYK